MKKSVGKRRYFGEATGKALAAFLNDRTRKRAQTETTWSNPDQVAGEPGAVDQVLLRLISLGQRCHASPNPHVRESLKQEADTLLLDVKFNPVIVDIHGTWTVHWEAYNPSEDPVRLWLELVALGLHSRLRQCARKKCRRWYYARFDHTSFHSIKCRDANAKEDSVRREKRRAYERRYYRDKSPIWKLKGEKET